LNFKIIARNLRGELDCKLAELFEGINCPEDDAVPKVIFSEQTPFYVNYRVTL
jgi:hypothetical protein